MRSDRGTRFFVTLVLAALLTLGFGAGTAQAQDRPYVDDSGQDAGGVGTGGVTPVSSPEVEGSVVTRGGALPFTGGEIAQIAGFGAAALALGGALVIQSRRRSRHAEAAPAN